MQHLTQLKPLDRFTQVPNEAADTLPDLNSIGLLNIVLRHSESWHFTVDRLVAEKKRIPGPILSRKTAYTAMKTLIKFRWVAKVKFSDGSGHRHTAVFRTVERFSDADYIQICERYVEGAQLWVYCSGCSDQEGEAVLTRVRGTALLEWTHGEHPITEVMNAQVVPTVTIPTVGKPAVGGPAVGQPTVGNVTAYKKTSKNTSQKTGEGEEGGAHARVNQPSVDNSTEWGIAPQARQDPGGGSTLFARTVIDQAAHTTGLGLSPSHHQRLVTQLMPAALDAVARLGRDDITGEELAAWLEWGHDTTKSLYAVLAKRLDPEFLTGHLPDWVDSSRRPTPSPPPRTPRQPQDDSGASQVSKKDKPKGRRCRIHKTWLLADASGHGWKCLDCEAQDPPPPPSPPVPPKAMPWEPEPEPKVPEHCGQCHEFSRHRIRFDEHLQNYVDLGACPTCHPNHSECPRCDPTDDGAAPDAA